MEIKMLIDTGSPVSIVPYKIFKKINDVTNVKELRLDRVLRGVTGKTLDIMGKYLLDITIGNKRFKHEFYINNDDVIDNGIIGMDFLRKFSLCLDAEKGELFSKEYEIGESKPIPSQGVTNNPNPPRNEVYLMNDVFLPPLSEIIAHVKTKTLLTDNNYVIESELINKNNIEVEESTVCSSGQLKFKFINHGENPKFVPRDTHVGQLIPVKIIHSITDITTEQVKNLKSSFDLNNFNLDHLKNYEQSQLTELLTKFSDIFAMEPHELPGCPLIQHKIRTTTDRPVYKKPYRLPESKVKEVQEQVDDMLEANIIRHSVSPYNSPLVLVSKPDGSIRICVDYRQLNQITVPDHFFPPEIHELLDKLGN